MLTTDVENYPGFPQGIKGPQMMELFRKQAERFGTRIIDENVVDVDFSKRPFTVKSDGMTVQSHAVIIATGASHNKIGVRGEEELSSKGLSYCAVCDGFFFRNKPVIVVGGGDTAMEEAIYLSGVCSSVTVIHRRDSLRASKIMQKRAFENKKIRFVWNSVVEEVLDVKQDRVTGVRVKNVKDGSSSVIEASGVFVAIGLKPNTDLFKGKIELDDKGYIVVRNGTMTNVEGVFAAGDCVDHVYRQAVTAAGMGCMAALDTERWLSATGSGGCAASQG